MGGAHQNRRGLARLYPPRPVVVGKVAVQVRIGCADNPTTPVQLRWPVRA